MPVTILGSGLDTKALTVDQFFQYLEGLSDEPTKQKIYHAVVWVYRCIGLRANAVSGIKYEVKRGDTVIDFPIALQKMLWDLEADLNIFGAGYWLKDKPRKALTKLQRLNPQTVQVLTSRDEGITGFEQMVGGEDNKFPPDLVVYFRYYSPSDDLGPGVSPLDVALEAADLGRNANVWASKFFKHGAIPAVILHTEQMIPDDEIERVRGAWNKLTKGVERAWRTIVLRKGLKPEVIGQPIKDLAMNELFDQVRSQVAVAFGVPETMVADAANYATAKEHRLSFYQETIIPAAKQIEMVLNEQLFAPMGLSFVFRYDLIEAVQKDEAEKAEYLKALVEAGILTEDEAREALGYEPKPKQPVESIPSEKAVEPTQFLPPQALMALLVATESDLDKWERKALAKGAGSPFESKFIPPDLMGAVREYMAEESSEDTIKAAFAMARQLTQAMAGALEGGYASGG